MNKNLLKLILGLSVTVFSSSCATVFTGSKQNVTINSMPPNADVEIDGINKGVTPLTVKLKKGFSGQSVSLKKEGYDTKIFQPETSFNPVAVINLFSLLGWAIDAATGAMMKYNPKVYEIKLQPSQK